MKKLYPSFFYLLFFLLFFQENGSSQINVKNCSNTKTGWTTNNPFHTDVFVENFGQFNNWAKTPSPIKYAVNSSDKIFFTQQGVTFRLEKVETMSEEDHEEMERKGGEESRPKIETYFVNMHWEGSNPNALMEVNAQAEGYYTFGEQGYENIKAKGYKKLTYKNLYPQIDVEYTIPEKGGIKYQLILHPGADVSVVKMDYTGDVEEIQMDNDGNALIKTPTGDIADHAPQSFYEDGNTPIFSAFKIKENTVSFKLKIENFQKTIIIDPWTTTPTSLTSNQTALDVSFDDLGNTYISGGSKGAIHKLAKYSPTGTIMWTFTNPSGWSYSSSYYSKFCTLPQTGTVFIGEGVSNSGSRIMKISTEGSLVKTSSNFSGSSEIWLMFYNRCKGQLLGFGGGTNNSNNILIVSDTNLTSGAVKNFNGYPQYQNDIASAKMDNNGDFYALNSSATGTTSHLQKSLVLENYNPPPIWDVNTNYSFNEKATPLYNQSSGISVRANALALNKNYLFSYDGKTIKAWNKSNGNILDTLTVDVTYVGGDYRVHDGIAVDECNNVYVGGKNKIHVFTFNGSTFTTGISITTNIPNEVYDISLDELTGILYVSGLNFVTTTQVALCGANILTTKDSVNNCLGYASITPSGGNPPYNYLWSNGATTNSISGLPIGTYTVAISDNSCKVYKVRDTIRISSNMFVNLGNDTVICGSSLVLNAGISGATYLWANGENTQFATASKSGLYWVEVSSGTCKNRDSINVTFLAPPAVNLGRDTIICNSSFTLNAGNSGNIFLWSTGESTQTISVNTSDIYWVEATSGACKGRDSVKVTFASHTVSLGNDTSIYCDNRIILDAGNGGNVYLWSTGAQTQSITASTSGLYWVEVTSGTCESTDTINVTFIPALTVDFGNDTIVCGTSLKLDAGILSANYLWSTGEKTQTITVNASGKYWVQVNGCIISDTISVNLIKIPVVNLGSDTSLCQGQTITLDAGNIGAKYVWSGGDTSKTYTVSAIGIYWVVVKNYLCESSDSININYSDCEILITMPNVFTPNGDGKNDKYLPIIYKGILEANIKIYNRWGSLVYKSDSLLEGWDGKDNGTVMCSDGIYYWIVDYTDISNNHKVIAGFLSLLK